MANLPSKSKLVASCKAMAAGLNEHFAGQIVALGGRRIAISDVVAQVDAFVAQKTATDAAFSEWKQQLAALAAATAGMLTTLRLLRRFVQAAFGPRSEMLADFGVAPVRAPVISADARLAAVEKARATRGARHTMGKRQRAAIHGKAA